MFDMDQSRRVWLAEDEGQTALLIEGVVQSVIVPEEGPLGPGYWPLMVPEVRPSRAVILGLGGGTIIHLMRQRFGEVPTVGVEIDPEVIRLARGAFGVDKTATEIVEADAFAWIAGATGRYDYIAVDLFAGGAIPPRVFTKPFLKEVKRLLTPGGLAAINFFKDRRIDERFRCLEAVFPRVTLLESRKNVVARCRAR